MPKSTVSTGYFQGDGGTAIGDKANIFRTVEKTLNTNTTIAATDNSYAPGPITVASGVTLTVTSGGRLVIL